MRKVSGKKIVYLVFLIIVIYMVVCAIFPPIIAKPKIDYTELSNDLYKNFSTSENTERILCIDDNEQALLWRLRLINAAKDEIILSTFNFQDDDSGRDIMSALCNAADRGVNVKVVVDGVNAFLDLTGSKWFKTMSKAPNIEVKVYNPINFLNLWNANYRMHDKYLIVDNNAYILGGRNTKNLSLGDYSGKKDIDRDVLVYTENYTENTSIARVRKYFDKIWNNKCTKPLFNVRRSSEKTRTKIEEHYAQLAEKYPLIKEDIDFYNETIGANSVTLLVNPVYNKNKEPLLWESLCLMMEKGKIIDIHTPYVIFDRNMYDGLKILTDKGCEINIITNGIESGANICGCADYLNQKKNILKTGANIYEYIGEHSSHTKTVLIDDNISMIGSFNFDMRSAYIDTEMMLVIDSKELNSYLRNINNNYKRQSKYVKSDGFIAFGEMYEKRDISIFKKFFYTILRVLIIPFRHIL